MLDSPQNAGSDTDAQEAVSSHRADRVPSPTSVMSYTEADSKLNHNASHRDKACVAPWSPSPPVFPPRQECMHFDQLRHRILEERTQRAVLQSAVSSELDFMTQTGGCTLR